jgi:hypothetical protein
MPPKDKHEKIKSKRAADPEYDKKRKRDNAIAAQKLRKKKKLASTFNPEGTASSARVASPNPEIIPSTSSPLHCKLREMMSLWEKLYPSTRQDHGLQVFRKLLQMPLESLPTFEVKFSKMPTAAHLFRDLFADDDLQYKSCLNEKDEGNQTDFLAAWAALENDPGANINDRIQVPYFVICVKASENGLLKCGVKLPDCLQQLDVYISPVTHGEELNPENRNDPPLLHSIITPAGKITDIRDDSVISASLLFLLYGYKVLLTWPGSHTNREYFGDFHGVVGHDLQVLEAIDRMSGLKVTILSPGIGVELWPGMIHAVLSPRNSAIACWEFVKAQWLENDDIEKGGLWELDLLAGRARAELPVDEKVEKMYQQLRYGVSLWKCLEEKLTEEGGEDVSDKVDRIQRLVVALESRIPVKDRQKETVAPHMEWEHQDGKSVKPNHEREIHKDWPSAVQ